MIDNLVPVERGGGWILRGLKHDSRQVFGKEGADY